MLTKVRNKYRNWKKNRERARKLRKSLDNATKLMSSKEAMRELERLGAEKERVEAERAERAAREEERVKALLDGAPTEVNGGRYDEERAFYGAINYKVSGAEFDGPADGESAFKECKRIYVHGCHFNLRYPFWHVEDSKISSSVLTENCRAAFWYCKGVDAVLSQFNGIKALRECDTVRLRKCTVNSAEFGWKTRNALIESSKAEGEYFFLEGKDLFFESFELKGKYSFQYCEDVSISDSVLDTKDAFWHAKNVTVRNSVIKGEYLGWYSENLTLISCKIIGTQPLCYCKALTLTDCEMIDCDLSFERSEVNAKLTAPIDSIKNPLRGRIAAPAVGELVDIAPDTECELLIGEKECKSEPVEV